MRARTSRDSFGVEVGEGEKEESFGCVVYRLVYYITVVATSKDIKPVASTVCTVQIRSENLANLGQKRDVTNFTV